MVAKAGRISGAHAVGVVATQVAQAFNALYEDPFTGEQERIHQCWVVTNGRLGKEARAGIRGAIPEHHGRYVEILDGDDLWVLVQQYLQVGVHELLDSLAEHIEAIDSPYSLGIQIPGDGDPFASIYIGDRKFILSEKYTGQLEDEPFKIGARFQFPDTPKGKKAHEDLEDALRNGNAAQIPGEYVSIEFPEAMERLSKSLFGDTPAEVSMLHVAPLPSNRRVPVRISIVCDDGDEASLDYIEWRAIQTGSEELVLSNDDQALPIKVVHKINLVAKTTNTTVSVKSWPVSAPVLLQLLHFLKCMAKPGSLSFWLIDPGLSLGDHRIEGGSEQPEESSFLELLMDLEYVQRKTATPIYVPEGEFSDEDLEAIGILRTLLRRNEFPGTWTDLKFHQTRVQAAEFVDILSKDDRSRAFRADVETELELFGGRVPLGTVRHIMEDAKVADETHIRDWVDAGGQDDDIIELVLIPGKTDRMTSTYLDWEKTLPSTHGSSSEV